MKIGIVTFYNAHNYGAVWQAYALKKYLEKTGNESEIIQYRNPSLAAVYPRKLYPRLGKKDFVYPSRWKKSLEEFRRVIYSKEEWAIQFQSFENFINEYLCESSKEDWRHQVYDKDLIFFGSDQIWEEKIIGEHKGVYVGDFETKARKVSYAASCFSEDSCLSDYMIDNLKKFERISVREPSLAGKLKKILRRDINVAADPVFLLNADVYKTLIKGKSDREPYVLFYFVNEDPELKRVSNYIKNVLNKKVIEIHYYKIKRQSEEGEIFCAGPLEFLQLFYEASEIYTNSFHGTAFSVIFHKNFYTLSRNIRIKSIVEIMGLENRNINSYMEWRETANNPIMIDYERVDFLKDQYIKTSVDFIQSALEQE